MAFEAKGNWFILGNFESLNGRQKIMILALVVIGVLSTTALVSSVLPAGVDWHLTFRPAAREILNGHSPYNVSGFFNPPWTLLPILPLALLPESLGRAFFLLMNLFIFIFVAYRLGASAITMMFFLISPPVLHSLLNANINVLVLLGFVFPSPRSLCFFSVSSRKLAQGSPFFPDRSVANGETSGCNQDFCSGNCSLDCFLFTVRLVDRGLGSRSGFVVECQSMASFYPSGFSAFSCGCTHPA